MEHETAFPAAQADAEQTGAAQADEPQTDHGGVVWSGDVKFVVDT